MNPFLGVIAASVLLVWEDPNPPGVVDHFRIYNNGAQVATTTTTNLILPEFSRGAYHDFTVTAWGTNGLESGHSDALRLFWPLPPGSTRIWVGWMPTPGELPTQDLVLYSDARDLPDGPVRLWPDRTENGLHLIQTDPAHQPTVQNGWVHFNGAGQFLATPLAINDWDEMTLVLVVLPAGDQDPGASQAEHAALFWDETAPWGTVYLSPFRSQIAYRFGTGQTGNRSRVSLQDPFLEPRVVVSIKEQSEDRLILDQTLTHQNPGWNPAIARCQDILHLGRGYRDTDWSGQIQTILIYRRALSTLEIQAIQQTLSP